jgi:hypothetical protein
MKLSWILCPIFISIAYFFLPSNTWTVFFTFCSFLLHTYLNTLVKKKRLDALRRHYEWTRKFESSSLESDLSATTAPELAQKSNEKQDEGDEWESDSNGTSDEDRRTRFTGPNRQNTENINKFRPRALRTNPGFRIVNS